MQMGEHLTRETVAHARLVVSNRAIADQMSENNYILGRIHYSYRMLRVRIEMLMEQYRARIGLNTKWSGPMGLSGIHKPRR